ncbi:MAG TPA: UDP-N-acetylglucosamine 2-epimerase (non-hydrolyzing) [Clostridia bacterium]|nr:UDP-N-acetylglucosamine 2-epimerase (non-hydrolyzing) [Clostridia bacterium]
MTLKALVVFGTRPEAIKMAPLVSALKRKEQVHTLVAVTAQHREMLDQVLDLFGIVPDYDLNIMSHGQTLADITGRVVSGMQEIIDKEKPDIVFVHGDTTTTFASALASFYCKTPVGHVEAGLRTRDKYSPFPEEMNRRLTAGLTDFHFAPTAAAKNNLLAEGINGGDIFVTGNTVIDALLSRVRGDYRFSSPILNRVLSGQKKIILVTAHRRENWGQPMENIFLALRDIATAFKDIEIIFPVHKNPVLQDLAARILGDCQGVNLVQPMDYEPFVNLMARSHIVLTDSGGLQEEAPALGKPVLVMRTVTERPEAVDAGTVRLVGADRKLIFEETARLLTDSEVYNEMAKAANPYGDGHASERITGWVLNRFNLSPGMPLEFSSSAGEN